jgi:hypothetical protein
VLYLLYKRAPDAVYQTKALCHLQRVARRQGILAEAERICLILQHWTQDKKELPAAMLRKGQVFQWIQDSAREMMMQYAELREPTARRIERINSFMDNHVSIGVEVAHRSRMQIFEYLERDFIPGRTTRELNS